MVGSALLRFLGGFSNVIILIFRESACGFDVNTPKICCPVTEVWGFKTTTTRTGIFGIIP